MDVVCLANLRLKNKFAKFSRAIILIHCRQASLVEASEHPKGDAVAAAGFDVVDGEVAVRGIYFSHILHLSKSAFCVEKHFWKGVKYVKGFWEKVFWKVGVDFRQWQEILIFAGLIVGSYENSCCFCKKIERGVVGVFEGDGGGIGGKRVQGVV